jgi:hypothetical protein
MITAAIVSIVILTTITVTLGAQVRTEMSGATAGSTLLVSSPRVRRRAGRIARPAHPVGLVHPQYLPALARARILQAQMPGTALAAVDTPLTDPRKPGVP